MTQFVRPTGLPLLLMRCWGCKHTWEDYSGTWGIRFAGCPVCTGKYWDVEGVPEQPPQLATGPQATSIPSS